MKHPLFKASSMIYLLLYVYFLDSHSCTIHVIHNNSCIVTGCCCSYSAT